MNKDLQNRIDETLNSLDGLQRAEANPFLYSKIQNKFQNRPAFMPQKFAWRMVIAVAVIALVNLFTIRHFQTEKTNGTNGAEMVANEYSISLPQTY